MYNTHHLNYTTVTLMRLRWWVLLSSILAGLCLVTLYYILTHFWPNPSSLFALPQMLLLLFLFVGVSSLFIPVAAYFNYRFAAPGWLQRDRMRLLRQGAWFGLFALVMAYLQLFRALTLTIAIVLASVFILIELFILTRD